MFQQQNIQIDPNGPFVTVEVVVGHAQHGDFDHHLYDSQGNNPQKMGGGSTLISPPPPLPLPVAPVQLVGRPLLTRVIVQNLGGPNSPLSVTTIYRQDSQVCGTIQSVGNFGTGSNTEVVSLVARFV